MATARKFTKFFGWRKKFKTFQIYHRTFSRCRPDRFRCWSRRCHNACKSRKFDDNKSCQKSAKESIQNAGFEHTVTRYSIFLPSWEIWTPSYGFYKILIRRLPAASIWTQPCFLVIYGCSKNSKLYWYSW